MPKSIYVYTDDDNIIHEIDFQSRGDLLQYIVHIISIDMAGDIIGLYERWQQNPNIKNQKVVFIENVDSATFNKTVYIYYHFKDNSITSITPRRQQSLDDDITLKCGLAIINSTVKEFIDGTKSMLNYKVDDSNSLLNVEEIKHESSEYDFLNNVILMGDYTLQDSTENALIDIVYENRTLTITTSEKSDAKHQIFIVDMHDKTKMYQSIRFDFLNDVMLEFSLEIPPTCMLISSSKAMMRFNRTEQ